MGQFALFFLKPRIIPRAQPRRCCSPLLRLTPSVLFQLSDRFFLNARSPWVRPFSSLIIQDRRSFLNASLITFVTAPVLLWLLRSKPFWLLAQSLAQLSDSRRFSILIYSLPPTGGGVLKLHYGWGRYLYDPLPTQPGNWATPRSSRTIYQPR